MIRQSRRRRRWLGVSAGRRCAGRCCAGRCFAISTDTADAPQKASRCHAARRPHGLTQRRARRRWYMCRRCCSWWNGDPKLRKERHGIPHERDYGKLGLQLDFVMILRERLRLHVRAHDIPVLQTVTTYTHTHTHTPTADPAKSTARRAQAMKRPRSAGCSSQQLWQREGDRRPLDESVVEVVAAQAINHRSCACLDSQRALVVQSQCRQLANTGACTAYCDGAAEGTTRIWQECWGCCEGSEQGVASAVRGTAL